MGRGRAKAKQTKVARELKYSSQGTDFDRLQQELSNRGAAAGGASAANHDDDDDGYEDRWASSDR